jgi:hypothetical protein
MPHRSQLLYVVTFLTLAGCTGEALIEIGSGGGIGGPGGTGGTSSCTDCAFTLPARIRRLTNEEIDASATTLLGIPSTLGKALPSEFRQNGFTRNEGQVVDSLMASALDAAAAELARATVSSRLDALVSCAGGVKNETCARSFIEVFAKRAFRRAPTSEELTALGQIYAVGAEVEGFANGIQWVIRAVLQSPGFLYVTELGEPGTTGADFVMTGPEIASALSYLITGGPPDDELLAAASTGSLSLPPARRMQAQRLLQLPSAHRQWQNLVLEWLGLDALENLTKDAALYPDFASLRPHMMEEAKALVDDTLYTRQAPISELFTRNSTIAHSELASFYGLTGSGEVSLASTPRRGILSLSAFLSVYSNPADSGPILRGVNVLRRVLCHTIPDPGELNINVVPPPPNPDITTRERFALHSVNPSCRGCHNVIDPVGFSFEHFDAMGGHRTTENGHPVETQGTLPVTSIAGAFSSSTDLLERVGPADETQSCFARQVFRFGSARHDAESEGGFVRAWSQLEETRRGNPFEVLLAYVESTGFVFRRQP